MIAQTYLLNLKIKFHNWKASSQAHSQPAFLKVHPFQCFLSEPIGIKSLRPPNPA